MDLRDRRILITGGTSGIGLELARRLAAENRVAVGARHLAGLQGASVESLDVVHLDVTSEVGASAALDEVVERLGGLDILVNSAGVLRAVDLTDSAAAAAVEAEVEVNLVGSIRMTRLALPYLRGGDGAAVVFLSSALALAAAPGLASYAATKAAVHSFARSLRAEFGGEIRVFDVLPPFVDTPLAARIMGAKLSPAAVAARIVDGMRHDQFEIRVGRANSLARLARLWPAAADRIVAREVARATHARAVGAG